MAEVTAIGAAAFYKWVKDSDTSKGILRLGYDEGGKRQVQYLSFANSGIFDYAVEKIKLFFGIGGTANFKAIVDFSRKEKILIGDAKFSEILDKKIDSFNEKTICNLFRGVIEKKIVESDEKEVYKEIPENEEIEAETDLSISESEKIPRGVGLGNAGNTCYQNSLVQALRHSPEFRKIVNNITAIQGSDFQKLQNVFHQIETATSFIPGDEELLKSVRSWFKETVGFEKASSGSEEDSSELLEKILQESGKYDDLFVTNRNIFNLTADSPDAFPSLRLKLTGDNSENAPTVQEIITKMNVSLDNIPNFLPITLDRVVFNDEKKVTEKSFATVTPSLTIIVTCNGKEIAYKLRAVILHSGTQATNGHYMTAVPKDEGGWIKYNDSGVSDQLDEDILNDIQTQGYVYLYDRVEGQ